jgi:dihydroflavonol-4-reductase
MIHVERRALEGLDIETVRADVLEPASLDKAFEGVDTVFHLAASISLSDNRKMKAVNAVGTRNVVEACLRKRVRRMVHFSSIHAVAYSAGRDLVDESCPLVASLDCEDYGRSKAGAEGEVHKGLEGGLSTIIVRPTAMLGPHDYQPSFFGQVLLALARGKLPALVAGGFDWADVRDVVEGAVRAEETAPSGAEYLLSGHWATLRDVAEMISRITNSAVPKFTCPLWLAGLAAPLATCFDRMSGRRPLFTSFSIDSIRKSERVSHQRASTELGYQPRPLQSSIEDTLKWFGENGRLRTVGSPGKPQ